VPKFAQHFQVLNLKRCYEAIRDWINNPVDTYYIIGSVVGPHPYPDMVARFQSVVSEEIKIQLLEKKEEKILI
jgi:tryptophan synthase beta chain